MRVSRLAADSLSSPISDSRQPASSSDAGSSDRELHDIGSVQPGRRTAIERARLHVFNFQVVDQNRSDVDVGGLKADERHKYIESVLRFVPVEVAMRYYSKPLDAVDSRGFANTKHDAGVLGDQAYEHPFNATVLFSDISGFTKLTNRLLRDFPDEGAEILNGIINKYFEELITIITRHAGDVIKFAGDAVLSIWSSNASGESLETLTNRAVACALEQIQRLHNWDTGRGEILQLHLGLGAGTVRGVDLGNYLRREFVVAGEPLKQLSEAEQQAESGQLVVSPQAWKLIENSCAGYELPEDSKFGPGFHVVTRCARPPPLPPHWRVVLEQQMKNASIVPAEALRNMWVYAPGPMRPHLISGKLSAASYFREVTMMFIRIGGLHYSDPDFVEQFQRVVYMIFSAVYVFNGSLSRVSIDDKGTCVKVTFGLPPLYHPDDPARAVRCALLIRDEIRPMRSWSGGGLKANIGITTGKVFVGYVGSGSRGEYTEYGVMVNMAARFMGQAMNEVLVNSTTYEKALKTDNIDFDELPAVKMKGFDEPVKKYRAVAQVTAAYYEPEYAPAIESRAEGRARAQSAVLATAMVGQRDLVSACEAALSTFVLSGDSFVMFIKGETGIGKTRLVEEIIAHVAPQHDIVCLQAAASEQYKYVDLYVAQEIFRQMPRLLGYNQAAVAGRKKGNPTPKEREEALKSVRSVYRKWLYTPPQLRQQQEPKQQRGSFSVKAQRGSFSLEKVRRTTFTQHTGGNRASAKMGETLRASATHQNAAALTATPSALAPPAQSSLMAPSVVASPAQTERGLGPGLLSNALELISGAPSSAPEVTPAMQAAQANFEQEAARFRLHESLLNDVLDCGFEVKDETMELSEEVKVELRMLMLAHILDSALYELESKENRKALLVIEDVQYMDSASWTLLHRFTEVVSSLSILITYGPEGSSTLARGGGDLASSASSMGSSASYAVQVADLPVEAYKFLKTSKLQQHEVRALERQDVHDLLCVKLGVQMVQLEVVNAVYQRTAGNALYCIELSTTMLERKVLQLQNDVCKLAIPVEELATLELPNSLTANMSQRLEAPGLSVACVACIKAASVMGMQFPAVMLASLGLEGCDSSAEREALLNMAIQYKLIDKVLTPSPWSQLLDGGSDGEPPSGGVYRFSRWALREVAYNSLPFEERRQKHLGIARWIEHTINKLLEGKKVQVDTLHLTDAHLCLWLYPMLGDHWLQMTGSDAALRAVSYFDRAAKAALQASMNHEAIVFIKKELKLLKERGGSDKGKIETQRALAQTMLADASLAVGTIPEAKEVILDALDVLDRPVESSREVLRKRFRAEFRWLRNRPGFYADVFYARKKHLSDEEALTVARLYEHLGRAAYLLEEMELHDMAVLRCLNLARLLCRRVDSTAAALSATLTGDERHAERLRPYREQLARAYAAACIVDRISHDGYRAQRFLESSNYWAAKLEKPPALMLYTNMMFGLSAMREPDWQRAEKSLREAAKAANATYSGRRGEEVLHSLGLVLYMSGKLEDAFHTFEAAAETCVARHDVQMLGKLNVGLAALMLPLGRNDDALSLLEDTLEGMLDNMKGTAISANVFGLAALAHLRAGDEDRARSMAEEALDTIKSSSITTLATFWGITSAIEVLLLVLAESNSKLDFETAKSIGQQLQPKLQLQTRRASAETILPQKAEASNTPAEASSAEASGTATNEKRAQLKRASTTSSIMLPAHLQGMPQDPAAKTSAQDTAAKTPPQDTAKSPPSSKRVALKTTPSGSAPGGQDSPSASSRWKSGGNKVMAANTFSENGMLQKPDGSRATRRRLSLTNMIGLGGQKLTFTAPDADQLTFTVLLESLDHFARFADQHGAAQPRLYMYQGMLRANLGKTREATDLFRQSIAAAKARHMPYDAALATRELAKLEKSRVGLVNAQAELSNLGAVVDAANAREAISKLPVKKQRKMSDGARHVGVIARAMRSMSTFGGSGGAHAINLTDGGDADTLQDDSIAAGSRRSSRTSARASRATGGRASNKQSDVSSNPSPIQEEVDGAQPSGERQAVSPPFDAVLPHAAPATSETERSSTGSWFSRLWSSNRDETSQASTSQAAAETPTTDPALHA